MLSTLPRYDVIKNRTAVHIRTFLACDIEFEIVGKEWIVRISDCLFISKPKRKRRGKNQSSWIENNNNQQNPIISHISLPKYCTVHYTTPHRFHTVPVIPKNVEWWCGTIGWFIQCFSLYWNQIFRSIHIQSSVHASMFWKRVHTWFRANGGWWGCSAWHHP